MANNPLTSRAYSQRYYQILEARKRLPVWEQRNEFFEMVSKVNCFAFQFLMILLRYSVHPSIAPRTGRSKSRSQNGVHGSEYP